MKLGGYGAKRIIAVENSLPASLDNRAYSYLISEIALKTGATVIILSNNNTGKAIAPGLSVRLKAAVGSGVSRLPLSTDPFTVYKRTYSGNAFAHLVLKTGIRIITLAQNSFSLIETSNTAS
jgi:electron transfer flavoprotein alpha subunit